MTNIIIEMDGGLIQRVSVDHDDVNIRVLDYDIEDIEKEDISLIPQGIEPGSRIQEAYAFEPEIDVSPKWVAQVKEIYPNSTD
jgi:hypothetical protein